jgi:phage gp29-like protein
MVNLDKLAGGHMRKAAADYRRQTVGPLVEALKGSQSAKGALERLDARLLRRMDATALETAVSDDYVQSAMIGRASALPKSEVRNEK